MRYFDVRLIFTEGAVTVPVVASSALLAVSVALRVVRMERSVGRGSTLVEVAFPNEDQLNELEDDLPGLVRVLVASGFRVPSKERGASTGVEVEVA